MWLEPYPDDLLDDMPDPAAGPEARYEAKETIALAFVAALQHLPPRQRAVLLLRDAAGFRTAEVAGILETTEAAVSSALRRARATMAARLPGPGHDRPPPPHSPREKELTERFAAAFASDDIDAVVSLLTDDAWYTMPPATLEYQGRAAIAGYLRDGARWRGGRRYRLIPTRANGQPAFACYLADAHTPCYHAHGLMVLTLEGERISAIIRFVDNSILSRFGFPRTLGLT